MINISEWGINSRVIFTGIVPVVLFSATFGWYINDARTTDLLNARNERGKLISSTLATASEFAVATRNSEQIRILVDSAMNQIDVVGIRVIDETKKMIFKRGNLDGNTNIEINQYSSDIISIVNNDLGFDNGESSTIADSMLLLGTIEVYISNESYLIRQNNMLLNTIIIILLGILASVILAMVISVGLVRPIREVVNTVRSLTNGNLSRRIKVASGGELGKLQSGINEMAETIETSQEKLEYKIKEAIQEKEETIIELKDKNIELDKTRNEAMQAKDAKSEFLANMSHEIRTPLNAIIGFSKQLKRTNLEEDQIDFSNTINSAANQLLCVIDDILNFSKLESGNLIITPREFRLRDCLENIVSMLCQSVNEKSVELVLLIDADVPDIVVGDSDRISQVLTNLVNNAIKFTSHGSVVIHIAAETENSIIKVSVSDTGCGMSVEAQSKLFTPFYQENQMPTKRTGGTGLGLVISQRLINMMGGELDFNSEQDVGSNFYFNLAIEFITHHDFDVAKIDTRVYVLDGNQYSRRAIRNNLLYMGIQVFTVDRNERLITSIINNETSNSSNGNAVVMISLPPDYHADNYLKDYYDELRLHHNGLIVLMSSKEIITKVNYENLNIKIISKPVRMSTLSLLFADKDKTVVTDFKTIVFNDYSSFKILVAEDNEFNQKYIKSLLNDYGFTVVCVDTGVNAVDACKNDRYDMILMDLHMPDLGGAEATSIIRSLDNESSKCPIIAITADVFANENDKLINIGFTDCIFKPIDENKLTQIFNKFLIGSENNNISNTLLPVTMNIPKDMQKRLFHDLNELYSELQISLEEPNIKVAREQIHSIIGLICYFKVNELTELVKNIQNKIKCDDLSLAQELLKNTIEITSSIENTLILSDD